MNYQCVIDSDTSSFYIDYPTIYIYDSSKKCSGAYSQYDLPAGCQYQSAANPSQYYYGDYLDTYMEFTLLGNVTDDDYASSISSFSSSTSSPYVRLKDSSIASIIVIIGVFTLFASILMKRMFPKPLVLIDGFK